MQLPNGMDYKHTVSVDKPGMLAALHCHNKFELLYVVSGDMTHVVEGRKYRIKAGDLILVHPSKYHYLERLSAEPYERYNILFDPQLHRVDISAVSEEMDVVSLRGNPMVEDLFPKMEYYRKALETAEFEELLLHMVEELFINLRIASYAPRQEEGSLSPILMKALAYINENLFTVTGVDEVAKALYISPSYLFYLFRKSMHQTPKKYILDKRLLAAQRMLRSGMSPTAVYKECGFKEYTTFFRGYSAFFGHAPSKERRLPD